jgi:hypothetical protein
MKTRPQCRTESDVLGEVTRRQRYEPDPGVWRGCVEEGVVDAVLNHPDVPGELDDLVE